MIAETRRSHVEVRSTVEFIARVASRAGIRISTPDRAQRDTGAVLATMADALPEEYFYDTVVLQLPNDYAGLLVSR
jgi:uncharacterized protein (DUF2267 family)